MNKSSPARETHTREHLGTPTDLKPEATRDISGAPGADCWRTYSRFT